MLPLDKAGLWIASTLTHSTRKAIKPSTATAILSYLRWFIQWIVISAFAPAQSLPHLLDAYTPSL